MRDDGPPSQTAAEPVVAGHRRDGDAGGEDGGQLVDAVGARDGALPGEPGGSGCPSGGRNGGGSAVTGGKRREGDDTE
jgi:hypothetical protein